MTVRLPGGQEAQRRSVPTFIEYSGYQVAAPNDLLQSVVKQLTGGGGEADPLAPASSTAVGSLIGPLLGFAVVSVQMRGSGCSGGTFDLFDLPPRLRRLRHRRGRRRPVLGEGGKVGMRASRSPASASCSPPAPPPHLAAVSPISVTADIFRGPATRAASSTPASRSPGSWSGWTTPARPPRAGRAGPANREQGDEHCRANQTLRLQTLDPLELSRPHPFWSRRSSTALAGTG